MILSPNTTLGSKQKKILALIEDYTKWNTITSIGTSLDELIQLLYIRNRKVSFITHVLMWTRILRLP